MKAAIIGACFWQIDISIFIPAGVTEIISGGEPGIDTLIEQWADLHGVPRLIVRARNYSWATPTQRYDMIVEMADIVIVIWDGKSAVLGHAIEYAKSLSKPLQTYKILSGQFSN